MEKRGPTSARVSDAKSASSQAINSTTSAATSREAPTLAVIFLEGHVTTKTPAHNSSTAVLCALYSSESMKSVTCDLLSRRGFQVLVFNGMRMQSATRKKSGEKKKSMSKHYSSLFVVSEMSRCGERVRTMNPRLLK